MKQIDVFDGIRLRRDVKESNPTSRVMCSFVGSDGAGNPAKIPFDDSLLGRHLCFIGGIGTGKTNAISQLIAQLRHNLTDDDVMIVFDSKGDFYNDFYRHGKDSVISNDDKSVGKGGKKDYWNIFNEINRDSHMEENIIEIASTLFHEKMQKTQQPFFPTAAKDLFSAVLFHCCRRSDEEFRKDNFTNLDLRDYFDETNVSGYITS